MIVPHFKAWSDSFGMVTDNDKKRSTGNGNSYTASYVLILHRHGRLSENESDRIRKVFHANEDQRTTGVLYRTPIKTKEKTSPEEYQGALIVDLYIGTGFARRFLDRLKSDGGIVRGPEQPPGMWAFMSRRQDLVALAQTVIGQKVPFWRKLWVGTTIWLSTRRSRIRHSDDHILAWQLGYCLKSISGFVRLSDSLRRRNIMKNYPHGLGEILHRRYGWSLDHPSVRWLWDQY
jgi:hypothetical protein